jgi:hypothetical protein
MNLFGLFKVIAHLGWGIDLWEPNKHHIQMCEVSCEITDMQNFHNSSSTLLSWVKKILPKMVHGA